MDFVAVRSGAKRNAVKRALLMSTVIAMGWSGAAQAQDAFVVADGEVRENMPFSLDGTDTLTVEQGGRAFSSTNSGALRDIVEVTGNLNAPDVVINNFGLLETFDSASGRIVDADFDYVGSLGITINNAENAVMQAGFQTDALTGVSTAVGGGSVTIRIGGSNSNDTATITAIINNDGIIRTTASNQNGTFSAGNRALDLRSRGVGSSFTVVNSATGLIEGARGVEVNGAAALIDNFGIIRGVDRGAEAGIANTQGEAIVISGTSSISADANIILRAGSVTSGVSTGTGNAISIFGSASGSHTITIEAGSTINGNINARSAAEDIDTLNLTGTGSQILEGTNNFERLNVLSGNFTTVSNFNLVAGVTDGGVDRVTAAMRPDGAMIASGASLTLADGSINGLVDNSGTLAYAQGGFEDVDVTTVISGTGDFAIENGTTVTFNSAQTFTGETFVNDGTLRASGENLLAAGSAVTLGMAGTLDLNGPAAPDPVDPADPILPTLSFNQTIGGLAGSGNVILGNPDSVSSLTVASDLVTEFSGVISGPGGVIKEGNGTLTLSGANTFSSNLLVNEGAVNVNGSLASGVVVASGGAIGGTGTVANSIVVNDGTIDLTDGIAADFTVAGDLLLTSGSVINLDFAAAGTTAAPGSSDRIVVGGNLTLDGTLNGTDIGLFGNGVYRIATYGGTLTDNGLVIGTLPLASPGTTVVAGGGNVDVLVAGNPEFIQFFDGLDTVGDNVIDGGSGIWDNSATNWTNIDGSANSAWNNRIAIFGGEASGTVTVADAIAFETIQFQRTGYAIVAGAGLLDAGTNQANIRVDAGAVATISATIAGSNGLVKNDAGTLILGGTQTYTGTTQINGGALVLNSSVAGPVVVANGATLAGSGIVGGSVDATDGAINPGDLDGIGTLTTGNLLLGSGSILNFGLAVPGQFQNGATPAGTGTGDRIQVNGDLTLDGTLNVTDLGGFGDGVYRLIDYTGSFTDLGLELGVLPAGFDNVQIQTILSNQVNLIVGNTPFVIPAVQFFDGTDVFPDGMIDGGSGTLTNSGLNFTNADGTENNIFGGNTAVFTGAAGTVTVEESIQFQTLQFVTNGYVIANGAGGLFINGDVGNIRVDPGATATIAESISGLGGIVKNDAGTLVLSGVNDYAGATNVLGGTLRLAGGAAAPDTSAFSVATGATLDIANSETIGSLAGSGAVTLSNGVLTTNGTDADTVFSGVVSGVGGLTKIGTGTLSLTGANTFTGATTVSAGTLLGDIGSGSLAVATGATFDQTGFTNSVGTLSGGGNVILGDNTLTAGGAADSTFSGVISGAGGLTKAGTSVLTLSGANTFTGVTTVNGGTLLLANANSLPATASAVVNTGGTLGLGANQTFASLSGTGGQVNLNANTLTVQSGAFGGAIVGTGGLTKNGTGVLTLSGANTFTGNTNVTEGELAVLGSTTSLAIVSDGGLLTGSGTVGSLGVGGGSTVSPGPGFATLSVDGNATFSVGSNFAVDVDPTGQSDLIAAAGDVTISGGTVRVNAIGSDFDNLTSFTILTGNSVSGQFSGTSNNSVFLDTFLEYTATSVILDVLRNDFTFAAAGATPNQAAVGGALDSAPRSELSRTIINLGLEDAQASLNTLSGEVYATTLALIDRNAIEDRRPIVERLAISTSDGIGLWADIGISDRDLSGDDGFAGVDGNRENFAGGVEYAFGGGRKVGIGVNHVTSDYDLDGRNETTDIDSTAIFVYSDIGAGPVSVRLGAGYTILDTQVRRSATAGTFSEAFVTSEDGYQWQAFGEIAYALPTEGNLALEPFIGAAFAETELRGTDEVGGITSLSVSDQTFESSVGTAGVRLRGPLTNPGLASLELDTELALDYYLTGGRVERRVTFSGFEDSFQVGANQYDKAVVRGKLGVRSNIGSVNIGLAANGAYSGQQTDIGARAQVSIGF